MNTIYLDDDTRLQAPCVATIGFFDGVHRGHRFLIDHVRRDALAAGMASTVITFDRHPRAVLQQDYVPQLLSTPDSKLLLLAQTGIDNAVVLPFTREMASLSAYEFMRLVLKERLMVRRLIIGYDNKFGHNRAEGFDDYVRYGQELGIEVVHNPSFEVDGQNVSSSLVRRLLQDGDVEAANSALGYPYTIIGRVVDGYKNGRKLGFPTANLDTTPFGQLVPKPGIYAVKARLEHSVAMLPAMMYIGNRPTFDGRDTTLEVYIMNFSGDIYEKLLLVSFVRRMRDDIKFDSLAGLKHQLELDRQEIEELFHIESEL